MSQLSYVLCKLQPGVLGVYCEHVHAVSFTGGSSFVSYDITKVKSIFALEVVNCVLLSVVSTIKNVIGVSSETSVYELPVNTCYVAPSSVQCIFLPFLSHTV